jgi:hypothetical protein
MMPTYRAKLPSFEEYPQGKSKREKGDDILFKAFLLESVNESFVEIIRKIRIW